MSSQPIAEAGFGSASNGRRPRPFGRPDFGPERRADPRRAVLLRADTAGILALLAVLVLHLLTRAGAAASTPLPALLGLLLGLPHGAVDHLIPAWLSMKARRWSRRVSLLLGYAATAGTGLLAYRAAPAAALLGFLVLAIAHFGTGDEAFQAERDGRRVPPRPHGVLAYGAPPVVFPLVLWRDQVDQLLERVAAGSTVLLTTEVRAAALVLTVSAMAITAVQDVRGRRGRGLVQLGLLATVFAIVPPALAFGVYFAAWHSLRHIARLLCADPANTAHLRAGRLGPPLRRFALHAAAPTAAVLISFALLTHHTGTAGVLPATFALLAAVTVPHAVVVAWLDRSGRVQRVSPGVS
ncbi:Brp/Blh family beta-carotene 15,15'-dioxygenase [Micromonospora sp. DR5-3]|uniref:Brp/Blh family beta-carotene 15,15'-dioxygenase n=1 Tax=unclassified Micromonospora TaxID=2617518 RepID=UPI001652438E|nr:MULTISPECIES: Brp/Blh family beta-carotene 15,15'-dioxygenase [unclassified Micromonospora]MCW3820766.1 Brp/Blh family beta-carotene 15,15'-dioxygenase [Micromonospora sp. DR5-3]